MPRSPLAWAAPYLALLLILGCQPPRPDPAGRYQAPGPDPAAGPVVLSLHVSGKGSWSYNDEEIPLRWEEREGAVWMHLASGGLITGRMEAGGGMELELPGLGVMSFTRAGP